jgi:hypothetical protein
MGSVAHPILVDRIVYATITIMSVLIIYDGWQHLKSLDVIGVIVGPVIAMFLAHLFSASLAKQVEAARALTWDDRATIVRSESRFCFSVLHLWASSASCSRSTPCSTMPSSSLCGSRPFRSDIGGIWPLVMPESWDGGALIHIAAGFALDVIVLRLQVAFQPGKAFSGGRRDRVIPFDPESTQLRTLRIPSTLGQAV